MRSAELHRPSARWELNAVVWERLGEWGSGLSKSRPNSLDQCPECPECPECPTSVARVASRTWTFWTLGSGSEVLIHCFLGLDDSSALSVRTLAAATSLEENFRVTQKLRGWNAQRRSNAK